MPYIVSQVLLLKAYVNKFSYFYLHHSSSSLLMVEKWNGKALIFLMENDSIENREYKLIDLKNKHACFIWVTNQKVQIINK